jgi:tRNA 5-methylaminomethyl-2-thiouridine biosynthesis bifunctional protein
MNTQPIRPARLEKRDGVPFSPDFGDVYHSRAGALAQAEHVFLRGNGLPQRWAGRADFTIVETGFGLGNNFLATWAAWRADAHRCERLHFVSVEKHPLTRDDLSGALAGHPRSDLALSLLAQWPPLTPNLHRLDFDHGRVRLTLALGDAAAVLPELRLRADAFYLDGFAPDRNPDMWSERVLDTIGRLAAPGATAATWSASRLVREGLTRAGFRVERAPGFGGKRDMTVARFAPRHVPPPPAAETSSPEGQRHAVVLGAGLAGASVARALAALGWTCELIDRQPHPAAEASGNPGGIFHGIVLPDDGAHARLHRAAALQLQRVLPALQTYGPIAGGITGLLRAHDGPVSSMQALLARQGLPADYVQALEAGQAEHLSGLPLGRPAWFFPGGGWLRPGDLVAALLAHAGQAVQWRGGLTIRHLVREADQWLLKTADGTVAARAPVVVLANASDAADLMPGGPWPLQRVRGQITQLPASLPGLRWPHVPVAAGGYVLPVHDGGLLCGATRQPNDDDPTLRTSDHTHNLAQLARLGLPLPALDPATLQGRVGWRAVTPDRLPLIGPVPDANHPASRSHRPMQPRHWPRHTGLYVCTGLGSRGITWSVLAGEITAAWITGQVCPIESRLRDAVDVGRFLARAARRSRPAD